jgi:hypothetical protein
MIKDRIIQVIELKGIIKENFFPKIGMTSANFRGNAKNTPLNSNAIENILSELPDVNPEWLITGRGEMLKKQENDLVNQSIIGDNNVQAGNNSKVDARHYYSDSPDVLRAQVEKMDDILREKDERLREKDVYITELKETIRELKNK